MTSTAPTLRPGSALASLPPCRHCTAPVARCFDVWSTTGTLRCCTRCDHGWPIPHRDRRPRPTVRDMPRGWTNRGWSNHVGEAKAVLSTLMALGIGRELGSDEGRRAAYIQARHDVSARIRRYSEDLLDDHEHSHDETTEIPTVPDPREAVAR